MELQERLAHYERALDYFVKSKESGQSEIDASICPVLCGWPDRTVHYENIRDGQEKYVEENFPEFMAMKPVRGKDVPEDSFLLDPAILWWDFDDFDSRIDCLTTCINKVKDEISKISPLPVQGE